MEAIKGGGAANSHLTRMGKAEATATAMVVGMDTGVIMAPEAGVARPLRRVSPGAAHRTGPRPLQTWMLAGAVSPMMMIGGAAAEITTGGVSLTDLRISIIITAAAMPAASVAHLAGGSGIQPNDA